MDAIFNDIDQDYQRNETILAADLAADSGTGSRCSTSYYQHLWDAGCRSFTPQVTQRGADMVASTWHSAWAEANFPTPIGMPSPTTIRLQATWPARTNGELQLLITGDPGQKYDVQTSSSLSNWSTIATVTNTTGTVQYSESLATNTPPHYYRAKRPTMEPVRFR